MKIVPVKNYKKPLYAVGVATCVVACAIAGCKDPKETEEIIELDGDVAIETSETDVELAGEETVDPAWTCGTDETDGTDETSELILDGEVEVADPTSESK